MNSKDKVKAAVEHRGGKVPVDLGASGVSGMHCSIVEKLRDFYGLEKRPVKINESYCMLGDIEDDLKDVLGVDVTGIYPRNTAFGFKMANWKEWRAPWGQELLVPGNFNTTVKDDGSVYIYPEGDKSVGPSGHMPDGGYFFDAVIRQNHFDENNLNVEDNLEEFKPVGDDVLEYFRSEADRFRESERYVLVNFGGMAFGDISQVPACMLKKPRGIRDITEWYMSTILRPDYIHQIFEKQTEIALANLEKFHKAVGDAAGAAYICGTDFGTQNSTFCSSEVFNEMYAPYYKRINSWIHANTVWKTMKHSCGAVESFMSDFIDAGFDIINPVQCSAEGMDAKHLKEAYGEQLTFWGGGLDTQKTLPFGTPEEVREEALERCEIFSKNGGFIFTAVHNVQANTPVENVHAMFQAVKEFNGEL